MKIRNGFISNSSSTSFCIIGTEDEEYINKICEKINISFEHWNFDYGEYYDKKAKLYFYESYNEILAIGFNAEELLTKVNIPKAEKIFQEHIKNLYNIDIPLESISFSYGVAGEG